MYVCMYVCIYIYIYIYIYTTASTRRWSTSAWGWPEKERKCPQVHDDNYFPPDASVQWQPDGSTIHAKRWFLGAGCLAAPPISLRWG